MNHYIRTFIGSFRQVGRAAMMSLMLVLGLVTAAQAIPKTSTQAAPALLTVSVSSASVCAGTSATLTAAGCPAAGVIRWSSTQTGASITVTPVQSTTYTAICEVTSTSVTTSTAVSSTATSTTSLVTTVTTTSAIGTVLVYTPIVLTPTSLSTLCNGGRDGQININATGGVGKLQYQFGEQPFQSTNTTFGNLTAGTYAVAVKDEKGCIVQSTSAVRQPPPLSVSLTAISPKCVGGSDGALFAVAAGGVGDYRYILNTGTPQASGTFTGLKAATPYTLAVTDKNSCLISQVVSISAAVPFAITLATRPARCAGSADGTVTVTASGGSGTYVYQIGSGSFQTGTLFTGLAASTYDVTVQDANGCQAKQTVTVDQPAPLQLTASTRAVNCFGANSGSITLTPTGGTGAVQYQIATGKAPQSSPTFTGLAVGDYTIVGTDANGCTSLLSVTIGAAEPLKAQAVSIAASCCVCPTGAVKLTTTGGTGTARQYQIIGQPYQASSQINGLRPNTYRLRVVDEVGCTDSIVAVVTDGNALSLAIGSIKDVTCTGGKDGEATVRIAGGKQPFTVFWTTERRDTLKTFTASQASLSEGTYTVSVVDSNRCSTSTVFVSVKAKNPVPPKPTITQTGSSTLLVDQSSGIQWYIRQGNDPGSPVPNATGSTLVPYQSGQYYVIVTASGCSSLPSDPINFILTALAEPISGLAVRIVPNPVSNRLRLEVEQADRSVVTVQLLDASGRPVMTGQIPAFSGKKQVEWPLTGVATGSYLLKVNADSRQSMSRVLVE